MLRLITASCRTPFHGLESLKFSADHQAVGRHDRQTLRQSLRHSSEGRLEADRGCGSAVGTQRSCAKRRAGSDPMGVEAIMAGYSYIVNLLRASRLECLVSLLHSQSTVRQLASVQQVLMVTERAQKGAQGSIGRAGDVRGIMQALV